LLAGFNHHHNNTGTFLGILGLVGGGDKIWYVGLSYLRLRNTSLAAPGALANRTARKANEANLDHPNKKFEITSL